ncbi:TetR family transcriptional regulator C-terminal domain-containing protein [Streptomyces sp. NPDC001552]|uniref:TetR family transcriptional regulator C-terminal domain-containing protein n=1 Tax=Streptomyces sp. NPDC001552 TaxID=3364587 RepID=UPI0036B19DAB
MPTPGGPALERGAAHRGTPGTAGPQGDGGAQAGPVPGALPPRGPRDPRWTLWIELWARTASNQPLKAAQEEIDDSWQRDLEALLTKGVDQGRFAPMDVPARASELLALLDGLSTRVVLGQRGADRARALEQARSAAALLVPRT